MYISTVEHDEHHISGPVFVLLVLMDLITSHCPQLNKPTLRSSGQKQTINSHEEERRGQ